MAPHHRRNAFALEMPCEQLCRVFKRGDCGGAIGRWTNLQPLGKGLTRNPEKPGDLG